MSQGRLWYDDSEDRWCFRVAPHIALRLKRLFPRILIHSHGELHLDATDENSRDVEWFLRRFPLEVGDPEVLRERARAHDASLERAALVMRGGYEAPSAIEMALPARPYQDQGADLAHAMKGVLIADELGLGKTVTGLTLLSREGTLPALVVCPVHLQRQWKREIERFLPRLAAHVLKRMSPYDLPPFDVLIVPYSKLHSGEWWLPPGLATVIFDECQELRRDTSLKYTAARIVAEAAEYRMGLSATPIYNYGGEFHSVFQVLAPDFLGDRDEFVREWCGWDGEHGREKISDPRAFGHYLREGGRMLLRTKKDVGRELPSLNRVLQTVDADLEYLEEIRTTATELARLIVSPAAGTKGIDLALASSEFINKVRQATGIAKAPYVAEFVRLLVESSNEPVVLFGWHREVYAIWDARLHDLNPAWYTGSETPAKKEAELGRFLAGETKVLMISLRSGSGVDGLQKVTSRVVFGELDWSPAVHAQCIGRVHRDGQAEPVFAYFLTADTGADPVMVDVLGLKRQQLDGVLDPKGEALETKADPEHVKKLAADYLRRQG